MNNFISKITAFLLVCTCIFNSTTSVFSQDFTKDMLLISETYQNINQYHGTVTSSSYSDSGKKMNTTKLEVKKDGKQVEFKSNEFSVMMTNGYTIILDERSKTLTCNKNGLGEMEMPTPTPAAEVEKLLNAYSSFEYLGEEKGEKRYAIAVASPSVAKIEICFDAKTHLMTKTVYYYLNQEGARNDVGKTVVEYNTFSINQAWPTGTFSTKKYVFIQKNNQVKLSPKYKSYNLVLGKGLQYN